MYAILAGAFVPLNFIAVRLASSLIHPRVLGATGDILPSEMRLTFLVSLIAIVCLFVALWKFELASKRVSMRLRALKRALAGDDAAGPLARTAAPTQI